MHRHTHAHTHTYPHTHAHTPTHTRTHTHIPTHAHTHTHPHTHAHMHIHTTEHSTPLVIVHGMLGARVNWKSLGKRLANATRRHVLVIGMFSCVYGYAGVCGRACPESMARQVLCIGRSISLTSRTHDSRAPHPHPHLHLPSQGHTHTRARTRTRIQRIHPTHPPHTYTHSRTRPPQYHQQLQTNPTTAAARTSRS